MDGSGALPAPVEMEGASGPIVLTGSRVVPVGWPTNAALTSCLREQWSSRTATRAVARVGVTWESVTLFERAGRAVHGCDNATGPREDGRRWCGGAYGRLVAGRLRDPRLDILCTLDDGTPVGFAWVEPRAGARYVVVDEGRYSEVYEVAGGAPVRIATTIGVDVDRARARFEVSEHDAAGRLLERYSLEAQVAG